MFHLKIWTKSLLTTLFVALLLFFPIMMVSDAVEFETLYLVLPIVLIIGTPIIAWSNYRSKKKRK